MVSDAEAVEIIEERLNKLGLYLKNKKGVEADIRAIRERKLKGETSIKAMQSWEKCRL